MEQTRGNYYTMVGLYMAVLVASAAVVVWLPPVFKTLVPIPKGRQGLFDFVMLVLVMSAGLGGLRAALAINAHWLPRCEMSEEQRRVIEQHVLPLREFMDRLVVWLAAGCVAVVLFNYF
jgi:hypothetical protein